MKLNKKVLAGLVAFAAANSAQAVTIMAEDGWTLGVNGSINQFVVFSEDNMSNGQDTSEVRDGLLPAFLGFDLKAPTMNGLDIAARVSFSPSTNGTSYFNGNNGADSNAMEQREVFFTVDGSFGQILAGKALGLYGSHNILTDQTLFGVGYGTGSNLQTTLGGIGLGYDYANWRSQVKWTSKDMNGFKVAFAVADSAQGTVETDDLRYEADLSYAGAFDGGSFSAWASFLNEDATDSDAWTVGGTLKAAGFEAMAQYSDSEAGTTEYDQYILQAGYRFAGTTLVSAQYSERDNNTTNDDEKVTIGVYHDVNANLKLVAEYTQVEQYTSGTLSNDKDIISLGGFVFF
jgi:predicted porin